MIAMNKPELRAFIRSRHQGSEVRAMQSRMICRHILNSREYRSAYVIGGFVPLKWEADIMPVLKDALLSGRKLVLPRCGQAPHMTLRQVFALEELQPDQFGIPSPSADAPIVPVSAVDLLLVPLEGIAGNGLRLGKGGGFYDQLLAENQVFAMGCALSWQRCEEIPREPWDHPLDACADCDGIHCFHHE